MNNFRVSVLLASLFVPLVVFADTSTHSSKLGDQKSICSGKVVSINSLSEVLYKPENLHGGRGPSFLVQNVSERTGKRVIEIRNARCEAIGSFGLFATDQPYGARYYSRSGGSGFSAAELRELALKVGSTNILVEGVNGKWIKVRDPLNREGTIRK